MADVTTYCRCTMAHFWGGQMMTVNETRASTDPVVLQNPQWWVPLTDHDLASGENLQAEG